MKKLILLILIFHLFLLNNSCKKDKEADPEVKIPETTVILTEQETANNFLSLSSDSSVFTFKSSLSTQKTIEVNDIVVIPIGGGFLRKVTQVKTENDKLILTTVDATLCEAIEKGSGSFEKTLTDYEIINYKPYVEGISLDTIPVKSGDGTDLINFNINVILYDEDGDILTRDDQIRLSGSFGIFPKIDGTFAFDAFRVKEIEIGFELEQNLELNAVLGSKAKLGKWEKKLCTIKFTPFMVMVGIPPIVLPVWIGPELDIYGGVNVDLVGSFKCGITESLSGKYTMRYYDGKWEDYVENDKSLTCATPELYAGLNTKCYIQPKMKMKIYNTLSPYLDTELYAELDASLFQNPWWKLYGGANIGAGVCMKIFKKGLFDYNTTFLEFKLELARAASSAPPAKPVLFFPTNNATQILIQPALTWGSVSGATSYDLQLSDNVQFTNLVYDFSNLIATTKTGSNLEYNKAYYWRVRAKNANGTSEWSDTWKFTTINQTGSAPVANFTATPTNAIVDQSIQFTDQSINSPTSWLWTFGDGTTSTQQNPSKTYSTVGSYTVSLKASNSNGNNTKTVNNYITVNTGGGQTGTVTDYEGNVYQTIKIGNQWWMAENLKSTKYNDGTSIPEVTDLYAWALLTTPGFCWYNNDIANKNTYGAIYNWYTVNTGKLAPAGWHVSTDAEWKQLEMALGMTQAQADATGWRGTDQGTQLKSTSGWYNGGNGTNSSGFSALPAGYRIYDGNYGNISNTGYWWSATEYSAAIAWYRNLHYNYTNVGRNYVVKQFGFSVRCVRD
jgi:uncharacterized protein (TIGR02145 family)